MKKVLLLTAAIALFAVPAMAGIKTSRHNLGETGDYTYRATGGVTQICVFCHTPHNPQRNVPLWNRNDPTTMAFKRYSGSATMSLDNTAGSIAASSISAFCLSCHDGSNGLWAKVKNRPEGDPTNTTGLSINSTRTNIGAGADLSNDHPVNVRLGTAIDAHAGGGDSANWNEATYVTAAANQLRLFVGSAGQDYVECASCHDPHKTVNGKFLRKSNKSSSLCLTCHKK